jgi:hypothetical protein
MTKAVAALFLALLATIVVGAFTGIAPDPERMAAQVAIIEQVQRDHPGVSYTEYETRVRDAMQRNPSVMEDSEEHKAVAILKMYPWVLGVALAILLFAFRPKIVAAGVVSFAAAGAFVLWRFWVPGNEMLLGPAIALTAGAAVYVALAPVFRINRVRPAR